MATVSSTFTALGVSASLPVRRGEYIEYTITGSATATVLLQVDRMGGGKWETVATLDASANPSNRWRNEGDEAAVRLRCSVFDSGTVTYSFNDSDVAGEQIRDAYGRVLATAKESGLDLVTWKVGDVAVTATGPELNLVDNAPADVTIALAAGAANTMTITMTVVDAAGVAIAGVYELEWWISEAATGIGLTADSYSGDVTTTTGTEFQEIVTKKHYKGLTDANGVLVASAVASAKPNDQYVAVRHPLTSAVVVSAASGSSWGA